MASSGDHKNWELLMLDPIEGLQATSKHEINTPGLLQLTSEPLKGSAKCQ